MDSFIALRVLGVIFSPSSILSPTTHTGRLLSQTNGQSSRLGLGIFSSIKKSFSFFSPPAPRGQKWSPGLLVRTSRGNSNLSRSKTSSSLVLVRLKSLRNPSARATNSAFNSAPFESLVVQD